jgi:hypothetical protein
MTVEAWTYTTMENERSRRARFAIVRATPKILVAEDVSKLAAPEAEKVLQRALRQLKKLSAVARVEFNQILERSATEGQFMFESRMFFDRYAPKFAASISDAQLASMLVGAKRVAKAAGTISSGDPGAPAFPWEPPSPPASPLDAFDAGESAINFPVIDNAIKDLRKRRLLTPSEFAALDAEAKRSAFTVAGIENKRTLGKIRKLLAERVDQGADFRLFKNRVLEEMDSGTFLSPAHLEGIYRNAVNGSFAAGQQKILDHPLVGPLFPYVFRSYINDDRVRPEHKYLGENGLQKTGCYRRDDPTYLRLRAPWDFSCRCSDIALSVRQAAERGVAEARRWLDSGQPPSFPSWVEDPGFRAWGGR